MMKKNSSGSKKHKDLQEWYNAPFPIYTDEEGERYEKIRDKTFSGMYILDRKVMDMLGVSSKVDDFLQTLNFSNFSNIMVENSFRTCFELLVTLEWTNENRVALKFRHKGQEFVLDYEKMHYYLNFPKTGFVSKPRTWNPNPIWKCLTGQPQFFEDRAISNWIKDESILFLHFYLSHALFGRVDATKVYENDLFVLECVLHGEVVDVTGIMFNALYEASRNHELTEIGVCSMATILCEVARMPICTEVHHPEDVLHYLDGLVLMKARFVNKLIDVDVVTYGWKSWEERIGMQMIENDMAVSGSNSHLRGNSRLGDEDKWSAILKKIEKIHVGQDELQAKVNDLVSQMAVLRNEQVHSASGHRSS